MFIGRTIAHVVRSITLYKIPFAQLYMAEPIYRCPHKMSPVRYHTGNNNKLMTLVKANFSSRLPTGRFCNGKLATDFAVLPTSDILFFHVNWKNFNSDYLRLSSDSAV
jgi:hypothetical protein